MAYRKMTRREALADFRQLYKGVIPRGDSVMRREYWNNYIDAMVTDRIVTKNAQNWSTPF